jgi:hypothetical protein
MFTFFITRDDEEEKTMTYEIPDEIQTKISLNGYGTSLNIVCASDDPIQNKTNIKEIYSTL